MRCLTSACVLWIGLSGLIPIDAAPAGEEAQAILKAAGIKGGLLVHLGCGDGRLTAALRGSGGWLVHGLDRERANIQEARRHIAALGLYGKVSVGVLSGTTLPYADNVVNLLVAEDLDGIPMTEVIRVLSPGGAACLRQSGAWVKTAKPRPSEIDEWTHYLHGPDNNAVAQDAVVGPPRHLQWVGGPLRARSHEYTPSISAAVSSGGRVFYIADEGPIASVAAPAKWSLFARDAFSGVLLWKRPIKPWQGPRSSFHNSLADLARRLVAVGDRVYVTLGIGEPVSALEAATGEVVRVYPKTEGAREFVHAGAALYVVVGDAKIQISIAKRSYSNVRIFPKDLVAFEAETGRRLWSVSEKIVPTTLAVSERRVFFQNPKEVICLEATSGRRLWGAPRPGPSERVSGDDAPTLVATGGVVLTAEGSWRSGQLVALSADSGEELWTCKTKQALNNAVDVLVTGGLVWTGMWSSYRTSITKGLDLKTGKPGRLPPEGVVFVGDQPSGHHHRCYRNKATSRYLLTARRGVEFIDITSGKGYAHHWIRGTCQYGVMPANGLLYVPPHSCACYLHAQLNGFKAVAAAWQPIPEAPPRLEKGPAYGSIRNVPVLAGAKATTKSTIRYGDWSTYRGDSSRSGRTRDDLPATLRQAWTADLGGRITPPVAAAGRVFAASVDDHTVHALDAEDGRRLWSVTVGGRVDGPPTICGEAVLFGSADGWVYCLRAEDGELAWRFRAAPADRRIVAWEGLESAWPVHGSVLVTPGQGGAGSVVWAAAGRSSHLSGGIRLCRLDLATGMLLSETRLDTTGPKVEAGPAGKFQDPGIDQACQTDVLSSDGSHAFMRHVRFDMAGKRQVEKRRDPGVPHLFSPVGFLDDSWWQRSYWVFGGKMSLSHGLSGWPTAAHGNPFGRILVFDETLVYGFGRDDLGGGYRGGHVGLEVKGKRGPQYRLFAADRNGEVKAPPGRKKKVKDTRERIRWRPRWARSVPLLVRAMTLTEERLFVAGPPDSGDISELEDALAGGKGGVLLAVAKADGKTLAEFNLDAPPVFDGMAAAGGRLLLSCTDGRLRCFDRK